MILICGASGLLGKDMCELLEKKNINFIGTYNSNKINKNNMYKLDFNHDEHLENFMIKHNVSECLFFIAERKPDKCENLWQQTKFVNIDLVNKVSYVCNKLNVKFLHISTDYVFDGKKQPNYPNDLKNPLQTYGISKYISELKVINNCKNYCIIRTPVLYSYNCKINENAVTIIGKNAMNLSKNIELTEDNYNLRRPLHCETLCKFILDCIENKYNGIYHFYDPFNKFTKYEIFKLISNNFCYNYNILPNNNINSEFALRPYDTQLTDDKITINDYNFINFKTSMRQIFKKFSHPKLHIENSNDFFIMLDLDGTIVNSLNSHFRAYNKALKYYNKKPITNDIWDKYVLNSNVTNYLKKTYNEDEVLAIKSLKIELLKEEEFSFTENSDYFIEFLITNNVNFCIVTNSPSSTVELFKEKLPILKKIKKWVTREDYNEAKPSPECYQYAKEMFYTNEKYIIGFEDSKVGYDSIKNLTDIIYMYKNKNVFDENDCFLFDDYNIFIK